MAGQIYFVVLLIAQFSCTFSCFTGCSCNGTSIYSCNGINLTSNNLTAVLGSLPQDLTTLILDNNKITDLEWINKTAKTFHNLTKVSLRLNQISQFPENLHLIFPNVEVLDLSENQIETLHQVQLPRLKELYLNNNRLEYLANFTFRHLNELSILSLERNKIQFVAANTFFNLSSLKRISLAGNKIATLSSGLFDSFEDGISVNVSANIIQSIPSELFVFESVRYIDLSGNEIWKINKNAFSELVTVDETINLENNILKMIPLFPELPSGVVKLNGNPLICNCDLFARTKQGEINFNGTCQHPENQRGRNINDIKVSICTYCDLHKPCQNKGHCVNFFGEFYECVCEKPFYGQTCEKIDNNWRNCTNSSCPVHSECVEIRPYNYECRCFKGFSGSPCVPTIHTDEQSRKSFYIALGLAMLGGIVVVLCFLCCCMRKFQRHESYMVVPSERIHTDDGGRYGGL